MLHNIVSEKVMKILIAEDEFVSRTILTEMLSAYGTCHVAVNGLEALEAIENAIEKEKYDLVCLDIMMPELDGQEVLSGIRKLEKERGLEGVTKVFMITALDDSENIMKAFTQGHCEAYLTKPIKKEELEKHIREMGLQK